jgi:hypothetical protein
MLHLRNNFDTSSEKRPTNKSVTSVALYVTDLKTNRSILLATDLPLFFAGMHPVLWSPSSNKLVVNTVISGNETKGSMYVVILKH